MLLALSLISAALLAYQVVLVHLLSITHWTHFAALVISLALLGFGASGSFLALARRRIAGRERELFLGAVLLAALSFDPLYRLTTVVPFDAFELLAVPRQFLYLSITYFVLSIPFFLGASAIGLAFLIHPRRVARVYAANLAGSGVGAALGLALLAVLPAERLPSAVGVIAALALVPLALGRGRQDLVSRANPGTQDPAALESPPLRPAVAFQRPASVAFALVPLGVLALALGFPPPPVPVSKYKEESMVLAQPAARVVAHRDGPLGRLRLVSAPALRYLPGASLALTTPVPPRPVFYLNGQPLGFRATAVDSTLIGLTTPAAVFAVGSQSSLRVLLIGLGGGGEIWHARSRGADAITVVDPDVRIDPLLAAGTVGADVRRVARNPRAYLRAADERFDRIVVTEIGSLSAISAGMAAAGEDYLLTREGISDLWRALDGDGVLSITRWVLEPPRDILRLLATVRAVLDAEGEHAADHVALLRSWGTATLLVSRSPWRGEQIAALQAWCKERWFDLSWAPGVTAAETNRFNLLEPDLFRIGAERLLGPNPEPFIDTYPFHIAPVSDDAPFFFHFLPLPELGRLWRAEGRLSLPYFEWGLIVQVLALAQAVPLAAALILLPLLALPRRRPAEKKTKKAGDQMVEASSPVFFFIYFALLGIGYMLLEISFIQRLILFLAQPVYATTAVLTAFLLFAGIGSGLAPRLSARYGLWLPFAAIVLLAPLAYLLQAWLWGHAAATALPLRMLLAVGLLAPLAFFMGMPFPLGLQRVADRRAGWLPWCWGVNGYLSVIGAAAAPLLALGLGFRGVLLLAVCLYLLARFALNRL